MNDARLAQLPRIGVPDTPALLVGTDEQEPLHTIELIFKSGATTRLKARSFRLEGTTLKWERDGAELVYLHGPELAAAIDRGIA